MPWKAIPYGDKRVDEMWRRFKVSAALSALPVLCCAHSLVTCHVQPRCHNFVLVSSKTGETIRKDGQVGVKELPGDFPWLPKAVHELSPVYSDFINTTSCLLAVSDKDEDVRAQ